MSPAAVRRPSRADQAATQASPHPASTTPPSGREPLATATPKPAISPPAAIGAVGTVASQSDPRVERLDMGKDYGGATPAPRRRDKED